MRCLKVSWTQIAQSRVAAHSVVPDLDEVKNGLPSFIARTITTIHALINLIHDIDNLRYMLGEIETVFAQSSHAARQSDVEDTLSISLKFENDVLGTILVSDAAPSPWAYEATTKERDYFGHSNQNCYHFIGTEGALAFPQLEIWRYPQHTAPDWQQSLECTAAKVNHQSPMQLQFEHFLSVIKSEAQSLISASDATRSLAAVLGILQSAEEQRPISLVDILAG